MNVKIIRSDTSGNFNCQWVFPGRLFREVVPKLNVIQPYGEI